MDFIDLDEQQDFSNYTSFQKFPISPDIPAHSRLSTSSSSDSLNSISSASSAATAIFLHSSTSLDRLVGEEAPKRSIILQDFLEFPIKLSSNDIGGSRLRFNPKGPYHEGRDSQVFRGNLLLDGDEFSCLVVAVKVYRNDQDALLGAQKENRVAVFTEGRQDFLKLYYFGPIGNSFLVSVWEWIDSGSLDRHMSSFASCNINKVIRSVAHSLNHLHSNHIAHHDLKPQNILIPRNCLDRVVLIDFGDSKVLESFSDSVSIDEGIGLGTLAYTAPELLSKKTADYSPFSADVYSFGVLLFYLLNQGKILPFATLVPHRAVQLILTAQKGFFAGGYNPESPAQSPLFPLMTQCLNIDPSKRPTFPQILNVINESIE